MSRHAMTPMDAAWYHIDGPVNFALVTSILLTRTPLDFEKVKAICSERLGRFDRFRQRVVESGFPIAKPYWEDMPDFAPGQQMHHLALPAPCDRRALMDLISDLASTPLDRERPLWQGHVVDNVEGGSALILRCHHCIGDGTAMMAVSRELFDATPDTPLRKVPAKRSHRIATERRDGLFEPAFESVAASVRTLLSNADAALDVVKHPMQVYDKAAAVLDGAAMLLGELRKSPDPASPLKGAFGLDKRVAWSAPVALADIKAIGDPLGAKINDVLIAGMTGALRGYLRKRGVDVNHTTVRALVPVDLRSPERALALGNEFGLVVLELAVRSRDALRRLRITRSNMDALKRSPEAIAVMTLFDIFGRVPKAVEDLVVDLFGSRASVVMTNVVGPRQPIFLAGVPIDRMMFWVPHPGRQLGMGISILSYDGFATLAVIADAHLVPDPEAITDGFNREFAEMLKAVRHRAGNAGALHPRRKGAAAHEGSRAPATRNHQRK
jgi:WS/DGAT/MGAT family acyltransferase